MTQQTLQAIGRRLPGALTRRIALGRPALTWLIPPGRRVSFDQYLGHLSVIVDTSHPIERRMLSGTYEPALLRVIDAFVGPGDVCLDVGANVGPLTLAMARRVAPSGRVYAFEPSPENMDRLRRNLARNPALDAIVTPIPVGLGAEAGTLHWVASSLDAGNGRLRRSPARADEAVPVEVTTLDAWRAAARPAPIAFMKLDVERMELDVLLGAADLLRSDRPVILFETLPDRGVARHIERTRRLLDLLRDAGYDLFSIHRRGRRPLVGPPVSYETLAVPGGDRPPSTG